MNRTTVIILVLANLALPGAALGSSPGQTPLSMASRAQPSALGAVDSTAVASSTSASFSFFSPSGNIGCQMDTDQVGCGTSTPLRAAFLFPSGHVKTNLHGGDVAEGARLLAYGQSRRNGPFRCTMAESGVQCVVIRTGRGFVLSRAGLRILR
jgi:hypothetical protein